MKPCSTEDYGLGKILVTENRINELAYYGKFICGTTLVNALCGCFLAIKGIAWLSDSGPTTTTWVHHSEFDSRFLSLWDTFILCFNAFFCNQKKIYKQGKWGRVDEHIQSPDFSSWGFS